MSKSINLLGLGTNISIPKVSQKIRILRLCALVFLFFISGVSIILFLLIALSPLPTLQKKEQDVLVQLSQYHTGMAQLLLVNDRMKHSEIILSKRPAYDHTLDTIQERMPSDVAISSLTITKKEASITVASSSLDSLDTFLNNLISATEEKKDFSKVVLTKFFSDEENGAFGLTITLNTL